MKTFMPYKNRGDLGWPNAARSGHTGQADIEFTSDCDLRCVYCLVSSDTYRGRTISTAIIGKLKEELPNRGIKHVGINGHGETTIIPNWVDICGPFLEMAVTSHLISNFARSFKRRELETLARVKLILVSLDTVDTDLLKAIRRKGDLRTIVMNIVNVRATAMRLGVAAPRFQVNAGIYDRNVFGLPDLARFCIALKIESLSFWSLLVHSVFAEDAKCNTVENLSPPELRRAIAAIDE